MSLNCDRGDAAEARSASPPRSGKPEGLQAFPLEPRVQGRFARIATAEDFLFHFRIGTGACGQTEPLFAAALAAELESHHMIDQYAAPRRRLRTRLREVRQSIPPNERIRGAERLARHLLALPFAPTSAHVAGYWAMDGEIALHAWQTGLPRECVYCLPVLRSSERTLRFAPWKPGASLITNRYGIPEPDVGDDQLLGPEQMELVVLPLVGFDTCGQRLGMGGGWYDRTFAFRQQEPGPPWLVGAAFASQRIDSLEAAPWDVGLDAVCTDAGAHDFVTAIPDR